MADLADVLPALVVEAISATGRLADDVLLTVAEAAAVAVASYVDTLHAGQVDAQVMADLATGLAVLARRPGGVTWLGRHWCTTDHDQCPGDGVLDWPIHDRVGAVYTPPWLAREITGHTLNAAIADHGPLQTTDTAQWRLLPLPRLLAMRVADIACGSGALLVSAAIHLIDTITDALADAGLDRTAARRAVASRVVRHCMHGVDVDPLAVAATRLCLALLAPHDTADGAIAAQVVLGDALLTPPTTLWPHLDPWPGLDAIVGNPPWLGGQRITGALGKPYRERLVREVGRGVRGSADLCAYFVLRAVDLLHERGQLGMACTNTISQGATREVGLDQVVAEGHTIWRAVKSMRWPTDRASVHCSLVWISRAPVTGPARLADGEYRLAPEVA